MLGSLTHINWLISLLAAVAMSVAASLLSSLFTHLFTHWSTRLASAREQRLQKELAELARYQDYAGLLNLVLGSVMRLLVFFSLASAINTLGNLPERMVPETPSAIASGLSTLFYLMSVLQGVETLRKLARLRQLGAVRAWPIQPTAPPTSATSAPSSSAPGRRSRSLKERWGYAFKDGRMT